MKRRGVLLTALLAFAAASLAGSPASSAPGGPVAQGNQDILVKKDAWGNIICQPAGPYVVTAGQTIKLTNVTGDAKVIQAVYRNDAGAVVASAVIPQGGSDTQVQGVGAARIGRFTVTDETNTTHDFWVMETYGALPGLGGPGLAALAILLMGSAAWALTRKRGESAV